MFWILDVHDTYYNMYIVYIISINIDDSQIMTTPTNSGSEGTNIFITDMFVVAIVG